MEDMNLEKIWKEKNVDAQSGIHYSREQISGLRKKRERQLTGSVKAAIITGLSIKFILLVGIVVFSVMAFELSNLLLTISSLLIITLGMISYDLYLLKLIAGINNYGDDIESRLVKLNDFLSVHLPVFKIENSLSTPVLVIMGMFYYHFLKYSKFEFRAVDDIIVFVGIIVISYALSFFASKYSLSAFKKEAVELLEAGDEQDAIINFEDRRKKNRKKRLLISLIILITGIAVFILLLMA